MTSGKAWIATSPDAGRAFLVAAVAAALVWAFSGVLTGKSEPWDSPGAYYVVALALAGAVSGALFPRPLLAHYAGAIFGQAAYELLFLHIGALFLLGVIVLAVYSLIFLAAAALVARLRNYRLSK